jgi:hypothetical protein
MGKLGSLILTYLMTAPTLSAVDNFDRGPIVIVINNQAVVKPEWSSIGTAEIAIIPTLNPERLTPNVQITVVSNVTGQIVTTGSLISIEGAGGIPVASNNILLTNGGTVIQDSIFG